MYPPQENKKIQWGWHGDGVKDEQLLRQSSFDIVAVFGDNVAVFGDIVAGVDGALDYNCKQAIRQVFSAR